jgi:putative photosynthetic complex assembly protein
MTQRIASFRTSVLASSTGPQSPTWGAWLSAYAPFLIIAAIMTFALSIIIEEWRAGAIGSNVQTARVELVFERMDTGKLAVRNETKDRELAVLPSAEEGFVATTVRLLARERRRYDVAETEPYRLTRWQDGRLTLADPVIGTTIDLAAFGRSNAAAFEVFLPSRSKHP